MFERFSSAARQAVVLARSEAVQAGGAAIGCEHLLLALLSERHGTAGQALAAAGLDLADLRARVAGMTAGHEPLDSEALASLGIDLGTVRRATEAAFGRGALECAARSPRSGRALGGLPMTAEAKKSLQLALRCAARMRQREITTANLLIGIIDQGDNAALTLMTAVGAEPASVRADVLTRMTAAA
jgi:ATP-dependent Clp protease ATP-binding subunit ClpA